LSSEFILISYWPGVRAAQYNLRVAEIEICRFSEKNYSRSKNVPDHKIYIPA
jgi:hypothetical protein